MSLLGFSRFLGVVVVITFADFVFQVPSTFAAQLDSNLIGEVRDGIHPIKIQSDAIEGTALRRLRRDLDEPTSEGREWSSGGRLDPTAPYHRMVRNFMRFGRSRPTSNDDVICLPAFSEDKTDKTGSDIPSTKNGDINWLERSGRDQGAYDYNGKPFMRFGKRFMRFGRESISGEGAEKDNGLVMCFREGDDDRDKRFMRFGKAVGKDREQELFSDMVDLKRFMRFGKSIQLDTIAAAEDQLKDEQAKS